MAGPRGTHWPERKYGRGGIPRGPTENMNGRGGKREMYGEEKEEDMRGEKTLVEEEG